MAKLKSKINNTAYSWKSDDIRDAEMSAISNSIAVKEFSEQATPTNAFEIGGDGMVLDIFNKEGQSIGHLALRPKNFVNGDAMELFFNDWSGQAWAVPAIESRQDNYETADSNNLYSIPLQSGDLYILSVLVTSPTNVFASNPTNSGTNWPKSVRLYNYDGTPYLGAATLRTVYMRIG